LVKPNFNKFTAYLVYEKLSNGEFARWAGLVTKHEQEANLILCSKNLSLIASYLCSQPCKFLLDAVFAKGMTVRQSKEELLPQLQEQCGLDLTIDR